MFSIGDFARHGRVSVRMLRHYEAIGLLPPAHVDAVTGYRSYAAGQFSRLNRIVALKELGFALQQVRSILDDAVSAEELRGMLRLRQAELQSQITEDTARLAQVEVRLQIISSEGAMPTADVQIKRIPAVRVAELSATAAGFDPESIGPVIQPLYRKLMRVLAEAGVSAVGQAIAYYEDSPSGDGGVVVHASIPVNAESSTEHGFAIVDLPEVAQAATIVHRGPMDTVLSTIQALAQWMNTNGCRSGGHNRELYLDYGDGDPESWVTELQEPIADTGRA